ncbi:CopG family nickel-responsive transcriptional regulator [Virgibacillus halotolerans]|uniref:nickel-responsive transcriptional regulator NikR n=1 Tax=Virgibacillus halotolerans TaxID=1071053 RepID=UPI0019619FD9|nr:nickel-responsive transcriptional regulator NikR [Virgibacillus halotolerans]MBM7599823.1 CopG family nickel-responsive transcriptional regulator [Virgibacillus halotolerans]
MEESGLKRFGISMEGHLLRRFDGLVTQKGYANRSEAIRDLVRDALVQHSWEKDEQIVAGSILLFYNHHQRNLMEELTRIQHSMHDNVLATTHFHLDKDTCLEMIIVNGKAKDIQQLSNQLTSLRGVDYGRLTLAPLEKL